MDTIDTLARPPFVRVSIALRDVVNGKGKLEKRLHGCRWDIIGVLMPYELHPSYPALQCPPDVNIQVWALRVYMPPSPAYGEYRWHPVDGERYGVGGLALDCGEADERQAIRLAKLSRGLLNPAGRKPVAEYFLKDEFIEACVAIIRQHHAARKGPLTKKRLAEYLKPRFRAESDRGARERLNAYLKRWGLDMDTLEYIARSRP